MLAIAHELRQPAAVIQSYLRLIRGGFVNPEEIPGLLEQVAARSEQLIAMFDDILVLGRLKERQTTGTLRPVSLAEIASKARTPLRREAEARG
jgi:signal transduction histidine kinase